MQSPWERAFSEIKWQSLPNWATFMGGMVLYSSSGVLRWKKFKNYWRTSNVSLWPSLTSELRLIYPTASQTSQGCSTGTSNSVLKTRLCLLSFPPTSPTHSSEVLYFTIIHQVAQDKNLGSIPDSSSSLISKSNQTQCPTYCAILQLCPKPPPSCTGLLKKHTSCSFSNFATFFPQFIVQSQ